MTTVRVSTAQVYRRSNPFPADTVMEPCELVNEILMPSTITASHALFVSAYAVKNTKVQINVMSNGFILEMPDSYCFGCSTWIRYSEHEYNGLVYRFFE